MATNKVFSDYAVNAIGIKIAGSSAYETVQCVGALEEELESKVVTKKCRGVVAKTSVRGTGNGTLRITAHFPADIYFKAYGMDLEGLIEGVKAYGRNSVHKGLSITVDVEDEDGNAKLKAYPNCIIQSGVSRSIENGAEEIAELEIEVSIMPDDNGNGMYETIVDELSDETAKTTWMTAFTPDMVVAKA